MSQRRMVEIVARAIAAQPREAPFTSRDIHDWLKQRYDNHPKTQGISNIIRGHYLAIPDGRVRIAPRHPNESPGTVSVWRRY